ncbi:T9SS type A sorting domain-containing protein [Flavobacterium rhizosphaerae]|uniref:T9SS type A sorting domain-containing protein n=1 Tax=Flavobacterium rhizosphaerae TaxID=3163298 RepID=A0ABW8YTA4_9FLAO
MVKNILFLISMLVTPLLPAQSWQWGVRGGSDDTFSSTGLSFPEQVRCIETDNEGNIYMLSPVGVSNLDIAGMPKEGYSEFNPVGEVMSDYAIASFDCSGQYRWSKIIGGFEDDRIQRISLDAEGNVYAVGQGINPGGTGESWDAEPVHFDTDTILPVSPSGVNLNKKGLFMVKYSAEGELKWLRMPQPDDISFSDNFSLYGSYELSVDPQGNSYWLCALPVGPIADGQYMVNESDSYHILKYDADGNFLGGFPMDMHLDFGANFQYKMARNHATGTIYIAGYLYGSDSAATFGDQEVEHFFYLAAFDSQGQFLWMKENTSTFEQGFGFNDIKLDEAGNIYLTGGTVNGDSFGGHVFNNEVIYPFPFVLKLDPDGNVIWGTNAYSSSVMHGSGIAISGTEVAITGYYRVVHWGDLVLEIPYNTGVDAYIARFDRATGDIIAMDGIASYNQSRDEGTAITADNSGNFYVGGLFDYQLYINEETLYNDGSQTDFFVAKYGADNCDCVSPVASFTSTQGNVDYSFNFSYTGSENYDSLEWDFGDGNTSTDVNPQHIYADGETYQVCLNVNSADCGTDVYCTQVTGALSLEHRVIENIRIYPNPVKDKVTIENIQDIAGYAVYNVLGSIIQQGTLNTGQNSISFSEFNKGIYLLTITTNSGSKTVKIIKE